jgi:hypothetical protein
VPSDIAPSADKLPAGAVLNARAELIAVNEKICQQRTLESESTWTAEEKKAAAVLAEVTCEVSPWLQTPTICVRTATTASSRPMSNWTSGRFGTGIRDSHHNSY